jgi:hypothetical protein
MVRDWDLPMVSNIRKHMTTPIQRTEQNPPETYQKSFLGVIEDLVVAIALEARRNRLLGKTLLPENVEAVADVFSREYMVVELLKIVLILAVMFLVCSRGGSFALARDLLICIESVRNSIVIPDTD